MKTLNPLRTLLTGLLVALLACAGPVAWAQQDPPGRVGRLAAVQGQVYGFDRAAEVWSQAEPNSPLTSGDRISTGPTGRAELQVGSTTLRLHSRTELEVLRLDDSRMVFELKRGSLALRVRSSKMAGELEIFTAEASLQPLRAGHYRIDRPANADGGYGNRTLASSWLGDLRVADEFGFTIPTGEQAELTRAGSELRHSWGNPATDVFAERVLREDGADDRREESRLASQNFVSPEMTGAADLDRHGRWNRHPDWGPVWFPFQVSAGWAPYKLGRWTWVRPWGWTWVDNAPWGFAPFHYGRWVQWHGRWGWAPGSYTARPIYSPGLVVWSGSVHYGGRYGPGVGWAPLSPREAYVPRYRHPRQPGVVHPGARLDERKDWRMRGQPEWRVENRLDPRGVQQRPEIRGEQRFDSTTDPRRDQRVNNGTNNGMSIGTNNNANDRMNDHTKDHTNDRTYNRGERNVRSSPGERMDPIRAEPGDDRRTERRREAPAAVQAETPQAPAALPRRTDPPPPAEERQRQPEQKSPKQRDTSVHEQEP